MDWNGSTRSTCCRLLATACSSGTCTAAPLFKILPCRLQNLCHLAQAVRSCARSTGAPRGTLRTYTDTPAALHADIFGIAVAPDKRMLATACADGVLRLFNVQSSNCNLMCIDKVRHACTMLQHPTIVAGSFTLW